MTLLRGNSVLSVGVLCVIAAIYILAGGSTILGLDPKVLAALGFVAMIGGQALLHLEKLVGTDQAPQEEI